MGKQLKKAIVIVVVILCGWSGDADAGGSATNGVFPRAQSMGNAFTAVADDSSAIFYNPAGLTQIKGTELALGFSAMSIEMDYTNSVTGTSSSSRERVFPLNLFLSTDSVESLWLGFGIYSPFARKSDFTPNSAVGNLTHRSDLLRLDFVPTAALEVGPRLSAGIGLVGSRIEVESDVLGFHEKGDGYGFTGQGGLLFKPHNRLKIGLNYRGPMKSNINGSGTLIGVGNDDFNLDLKFPAVVSLGLAWDYNDFLLFALSLDWERWSNIDEIRRNYTHPAHQGAGVTTLDSDDSYNLHVGMILQPDDSEVRFGYSYLTAAVPADNIIPAQPDYDGHAFSVGYSRFFKNLRIDLGYEFDYVPARNSNSLLFPGDYKNRVHSIMMAISYNFGLNL